MSHPQAFAKTLRWNELYGGFDNALEELKVGCRQYERARMALLEYLGAGPEVRLRAGLASHLMDEARKSPSDVAREVVPDQDPWSDGPF